MQFKRGATLSFIVRRKDESGQPMTGDASKLKSEIRLQDDNLVCAFTIVETEVDGDYLFTVPSDITKEFKLGTYLFDIKYTNNDIVETSPTYTFEVVKEVTR